MPEYGFSLPHIFRYEDSKYGWEKTHILAHCVKSVEIGSFFWSILYRTRAEYGDLLSTGKYGPEKTPYLDTFHAVAYFTQ